MRNIGRGTVGLLVVCALVALGITLPLGNAQGGIDSPCNAVLNAGIYNFFREEVSGYKFSEYQNEIQKAYNEYQKDVKNGNVQAKYGLFGGSVSLSGEQIKAIGDTLNSKEVKLDEARNNSSILRQTISDAPLQAWNKCIESEKKGLKVSTDYGPDFEGPLTITLRYEGDTPGAAIKAKTVTVRGSLYKCTGSLKSVLNSNKSVLVTVSSIALSCERAVKPKPEQERNRLIWANNASIVIETDAGTVVRYLGPIFASSKTPTLEKEVAILKQKVASFSGLIAYFLTPDCPSGWIRENNLTGRYPVGVDPAAKGDVTKAVGTALSNLEDRPAGQHVHNYSDNKVAWGLEPYIVKEGGPIGIEAAPRTTELGNGLKPGTNAPYVQLSACKKL